MGRAGGGISRRAVVSRAVHIAGRIAVRAADRHAGGTVMSGAIGIARRVAVRAVDGHAGGTVMSGAVGIAGRIAVLAVDGVSGRAVVPRAIRGAGRIAVLATDRLSGRAVVPGTERGGGGITIPRTGRAVGVAGRTAVNALSRAVGAGRIPGGRAGIARVGGAVVGARCTARGVGAEVAARVVGAIRAGVTGIGAGDIGAARGAGLVAQAVRCVVGGSGRANLGAIVGERAIDTARVEARGRERCRIKGGCRVTRIVGIGGGQRRPRDVAGAAQSDPVGLIAVAVGRVVSARAVGAGVIGVEIRTVQEVAVLIDSQADVSIHEAVVGRIGVRARVGETAAEGAEARRLAAVLQEKTDAVRPVGAGAAGIAVVGNRLERHLQSRTRRKRAGGENGATLIVSVAVGGAAVHRPVGEAQCAAAGRVAHLCAGARGRGARSQIAAVAADQIGIGIGRIDVVAQQHGRAGRYRPGTYRGCRCARRQAGSAEEVPVVVGRSTREIFGEGDLRLAFRCRQRTEQQRHSDPNMFDVHHSVMLFELV